LGGSQQIEDLKRWAAQAGAKTASRETLGKTPD